MGYIDDLLWEMEYEAEKREDEYREASAQAQEALYRHLDKGYYGVRLTLSEIEAIVASIDKYGKPDLPYRSELYKKYDELLWSFFDGPWDFNDGDEPGVLGDVTLWFPKHMALYLEDKKNSANKHGNKKNKKS